MHGNATCTRFKAEKRTPAEEDIARLADNDFDRTQVATADGVTTGWCGGDHELDSAFAYEKNVRANYLHFAFRVSQDKLPAARLKALYHVHLKALCEQNPSGQPTARQKKEAKELAREEVENEAKDGRYRKHTVIPVVWAGDTGEVWYGASAATHTGRFQELFKETFGVELTPLTAGALFGEEVEPMTEDAPAWCPEGTDWVGNEFGLWLLWRTANSDAEIGGVTAMNGRTLCLACPNAQTGHEVFTHEKPVSLPEVVRALQAGKLPRKMGLEVACGGDIFSLVLQLESWTVTGGKLVNHEDDAKDVIQRELNRLEAVTRLLTVSDVLMGEFKTERVGDGWNKVWGDIKHWLGVV